jgi:predicted TPR repeat methyltransferase
MASSELAFVRRHASDAQTILDIGIGTGRLLDSHLRTTSAKHIVGIDVAEQMVRGCRQRFAGNARITGLLVADLAAPLPFDEPFDFVSAVRVIKYDANWAGSIVRIADVLASGGTMVFSMANRNSLNRLSGAYGVAWHTASTREIREACATAGLSVIDVCGFSRLPYSIYANDNFQSVTRATDATLQRLFGRKFARELFVAARRA